MFRQHPTTRRLRVLDLPCPLDAALDGLGAALDGTGPALLPLARHPSEQRARAIEALRPDDEAAPLETSEIAIVVPTSGSTGEPKGVLLTGAALRSSAESTLTRLGGPGQWLLALPLTHIGGLQVLVRSIVATIPPVALDLDDGFDPSRFAAATARLAGFRRYTALVPTQLVRLLDAGHAAVTALASYDAVLLGGAAASPALLSRARHAGINVVTTYGMSETGGGCVYDGQPLEGVKVTFGGDGRIRLAGPMLFSGYRLRPDLTAAALTDGWHVTHDIGSVDPAGRLTVLGRADDVIVTGGENVALSAVQDALASHPGVREAAAVGLPDGEWGTRVVAVVAARPGQPPPELDELRAWVGEREGRAAAPRDVVLVDDLPYAGPGKIDRREVRAIAARGSS